MDIVVIAPTWLDRELKESTEVLRKVYGKEAMTEKINEDKGRYFVDQNRNQVDGLRMLAYLRLLKDPSLYTVWLTEEDLFINGLTSVLGLHTETWLLCLRIDFATETWRFILAD